MYEIQSITTIYQSDLSSGDLREEAAKDSFATAYRVTFAGLAQSAEAICLPLTARVGVAFGAKVVWTDCLTGQRVNAAVREAAERVVNGNADLAPGSRVRILNPEPGAPSRGTVVATRDGGRVLVLLDGDSINTIYNEDELAPEETTEQ